MRRCPAPRILQRPLGVGRVDSGVTGNQDLQDNTGKPSVSRIVYSESFVPQAPNAMDQYGHGTHVAGILAGNGSSSTGATYTRTFTGMARNANIVNLRVLDA